MTHPHKLLFIQHWSN